MSAYAIMGKKEQYKLEQKFGESELKYLFRERLIMRDEYNIVHVSPYGKASIEETVRAISTIKYARVAIIISTIALFVSLASAVLSALGSFLPR